MFSIILSASVIVINKNDENFTINHQDTKKPSTSTTSPLRKIFMIIDYTFSLLDTNKEKSHATRIKQSQSHRHNYFCWDLNGVAAVAYWIRALTASLTTPVRLRYIITSYCTR